MKHILLGLCLLFTQQTQTAYSLENFSLSNREVLNNAIQTATHPATGFILGSVTGRCCLPCDQTLILAAATGASACVTRQCGNYVVPEKYTPCCKKTETCLAACTVGLLASQLPSNNSPTNPSITTQTMDDKCCIKIGIGTCLTAIGYWKITKHIAHKEKREE